MQAIVNRKLLSIFTVAIFLMSMVIVAVPAMAVGKYVQKPFKGTFSGSYELDPNFSPPDQLIAENPVSGTMRVTHLGLSTFEGSLTSDWSGYTSEDPCASVTGDITITAANGDKLYVNIDGEQCEIWVEGTYTGSNHLTGTYMVNGGTGRFVGASGTGTISAYIDTTDLTFSGSVYGTITYNAAKRSGK